MNEKENCNSELYNESYDIYDNEYLEDIEYVQAPTLKDLEKKVRKKIENDFGVVEQNPFWDDQTKNWTQVVLYYSDDEDNEEEKN